MTVPLYIIIFMFYSKIMYQYLGVSTHVSIIMLTFPLVVKCIHDNFDFSIKNDIAPSQI